MAESVSSQKHGAAPLQSHTGHIRKIFIRNFAGFREDHELDFISDNGGPSPFVVFVGDNGTGKSLVLNCVSIINIFRRHSVNCNGQQGENLLNREKIAEKVFARNILEQSCRIVKTESDKEGIFVIEVTSNEPSYPIYCGLYSEQQEDAWYWNHKGSDYSKKYSHTFILDTKSNKFYTLKPSQTSEDQTTDFILEYILCRQEKVESDVFKRVKACIQTYSQKFESDELPENITSLLPSCFCTPMIHYDMKKDLPEEKKLKKYGDFLEYILEGSFILKTQCLLIARPTEGAFPKEERRYQEVFSKICLGHKIQFIITTYNSGILNWDLAHSIIRFRRSFDGSLNTAKVPSEFVSHCKQKNWSPLKILSYNSILLVEGKSDANVLEAVLGQSAYEGPEWLSSVCSLASEDFEYYEYLVNNTLVFSVDGKTNFPQIFGFFLRHLKLGLFNFIVCDGDALLGGSTKDVEKNPQITEKKSQILGSEYKTDSVLKESIKSLQKGDRLIETLLDNLLHVKCQENKRVKEYFQQESESSPLSVQENIRGILKLNCEKVEDKKNFCKHCLLTFAWLTDGASDLESVVCSSTRSFNKSRLASNKMFASDIAEQLIENKNKEICNFLAFIAKDMLTGYKKLEQKL